MILNECYKRLIRRAQSCVFPRRANVLTSKCLLKLIYIDTCLFVDLVFFYSFKAKDVHISIDTFI